MTNPEPGDVVALNEPLDEWDVCAPLNDLGGFTVEEVFEEDGTVQISTTVDGTTYYPFADEVHVISE